MDIERRSYSLDSAEVRKNDDGAAVLRGHAAVFDKLSENLGGFRERIEPGAFDDALEDDVRALFNHDPNLILGRTRSGTLKLDVDDSGLSYEVTLPDTQTGRDLAISVERGDIDQSSFAFVVEKDSWGKDKDGQIIRTILKVSRLFDVSPVTYPAYPDATVGKRGLNQYESKLRKADLDLFRRKIRLSEIGV